MFNRRKLNNSLQAIATLAATTALEKDCELATVPSVEGSTLSFSTEAEAETEPSPSDKSSSVSNGEQHDSDPVKGDDQRPRRSSFERLLLGAFFKKSAATRFKYQTRRTSFLILGVFIGVFLVPNSYIIPIIGDGLVPLEFVDFHFEELLEYAVLGTMKPLLSETAYEKLANVTKILEGFVQKPTDAEESDAAASNEFTRGLKLVKEGVRARHPLVLVPGIVSTGLESWSVHPCAQKYFRKRIWGTMTMFRAVLLDKGCWISHMKLDPKTGLDPDGIKIRAAQGLEAADYLIPGYWVWGLIISQAAAIGYDNNNLHLAAYDWRLAHPLLETRDRYFTKLKRTIEISVEREKYKAVLVGHSMGVNVMLYFFKWVESDLGGKGGPTWVDDHIKTFVNLGGPLLGLPKTAASLLSGEMRDTAQMGAAANFVLDKFIPKMDRADMFRSWGGLASMLPKGGEAVWGDENSAPDDRDLSGSKNDVVSDCKKSTLGSNCKKTHTFGTLLTFLRPRGQSSNADDISAEPENNSNQQEDTEQKSNLTVSQVLELIVSSSSNDFAENLNKYYTFNRSTDANFLDKAENDPRSWSNPLESRLPNAPNMRIVCMYGVGKPTERKYFYRQETEGEEGAATNDATDLKEDDANSIGHHGGEGSHAVGDDMIIVEANLDRAEDAKQSEKEMHSNREPESTTDRTSKSGMVEKKPFLMIDTTVNSAEHTIESGVRCSEGDGTVPLISLSYMCVSGWRRPTYNPGRSNVLVREYLHQSAAKLTDPRGGEHSGDHVDMLGNIELMEDLLRIAAGKDDEMEERIQSDAREFATNIDKRLFGDDNRGAQ